MLSSWFLHNSSLYHYVSTLHLTNPYIIANTTLVTVLSPNTVHPVT